MTNGTALVERANETAHSVSALGGGSEAFEVAQRMARALSASTVVPNDYQGNIANVMVAMEYANRLGASVLAVMQNLDVIHGRPSLRSTFLIGTVNATGRFTPIRWRFQGTEGKDDRGARAVAIDRESGEECVGPLITIGLAKSEGWYGKKGSKWQSIPELMLMYRSAGWWTRLYAPEFSLGLHTADEMEDIGPAPTIRAQSVAQALDAGDPEPKNGRAIEDEGTPAEQDARIAAARQAFDAALQAKRPDIAGDIVERADLMADVTQKPMGAELSVADYTKLTQYVQSLPEQREPGSDDE